jgi:carbamoyl-phosphate synthase / aspartate carbamoyltransferase / dihydroorotase
MSASQRASRCARVLPTLVESCALGIHCWLILTARLRPQANTPEEAVEAARKLGFPIIVRAAYALGGLGSGFANNMDELNALTAISFSHSPQVLVEKSLRGWKEIEYEVVRDMYGNCITVCNMENFDPLGIHTGESIVVAPSQTLDDHDYNMLRNTAIKVVRHLGVIGECNIQYALDPFSNDYYIIEVNARLSRSSALASKATGYPLAYVAAKLGLGYSLPELRNSVTKATTACFEPSLDYCVVKIPRWDLKKFPKVSNKIGSAMKSVGEVMAIGRRFEEALQKALRMVDGNDGFISGIIPTSESEIRDATDQRIYSIATAMAEGWTIARIHELSKIDPWFLNRLKEINDHHQVLSGYHLTNLPTPELLKAKQLGFCDKVVARLTQSSELAVRQVRKTTGVLPLVKQIDTVAAEYPACTNYLYQTYNATHDDLAPSSRSVLVLGSGVYRIGSSVEFDWCSVGCVRELRRLGHSTIVLNCNPETVSTDYDESERLYFDEISFEVVMDIYERESPFGVVLSVGGQTSNNIAMPLFRQNVRVLGTSPEMIDNAENRYKFSRMLDKLGIDQPQWKELADLEGAKEFCRQVGYPCLVRPSYVLSGAAMNVAHCDEDLDTYLGTAVAVSREHPVVISKFIENAKEIEVDAVAKEGRVVACVISEHVENAGVHSGDATIVSPAQDLNDATLKGVRDIMFSVAQALYISGPFNMQLIAKDDDLKVIECNVRASRSFPFVSKALDLELIPMATRIFMGVEEGVPKTLTFGTPRCVGVKVAQFSFNRLPGSDPTVGVDMMSTGEVACFGDSRSDAYLKGLLSTGFKVPTTDKAILLSIGTYRAKAEFLPSVNLLIEMGYRLSGSKGTADYYSENGITIAHVDLPVERYEGGESTIDNQMLKSNDFGLVINIPAKSRFRRPASFNSQGYLTRTMAVLHSVPLITDIKCAKLFVEALRAFGPLPIVRPQIDCRTSNRTVNLPGLIDVHVHVREPGAAHKEDWSTCTAAALAGGVTMICAMPNTDPAVVDRRSLEKVQALAAAKARCDFGFFIGATMDNAQATSVLAPLGVGLSMELDMATSKMLQIDDLTVWMQHFETWPKDYPILVRAENKTLAAVLMMSMLYDRSIHVCSISRREEIMVIREAKRRGAKVTCGVSPHHLLLDETDLAGIGRGFALVWPSLGTAQDRQVLWENMDIIDVISSHHAPHTAQEKSGADPPPGYPGLETMLPLLLTAVTDGRLSLEDLILRLHTNPKKIFGLPNQENTFTEVDLDAEWEIPKAMAESRCGWSPFAGRRVRGAVSRVVVRGEIAYLDGRLFADPGAGREVTSCPAEGPAPAARQDRIATSVLGRPPRGAGVVRVQSPTPEVQRWSPPEPPSPVRRQYDSVFAQSQAALPSAPAAKRGSIISGRQPLSGKSPLVQGDHGAPGGAIAPLATLQQVVSPQGARLSDLRGKSIVSVRQFDRYLLHELFNLAHDMRLFLQRGTLDILRGAVLGTIFYEPSTRTSCSFQAAMQRLGGTVVAVSEMQNSSVAKGETLEDFVRVMERYCDVVVLRHPEQGAVQRAASCMRRPVINAGDGVGEHPTQALLDIFTIREEIGTVNSLTIALCGDLKHGRTVHSLATLLSLYDVKLRLVAPRGLEMPPAIVQDLRATMTGATQEVTEHSAIDEVIANVDVLYVTRVQRERFADPAEYAAVASAYKVTPETLTRAKSGMILMHPLPRVGEIAPECDLDPRSVYFRQAEHGMYVRMALLAAVLGKAYGQ